MLNAISFKANNNRPVRQNDDVDYSHISLDDPDKVARYFIREDLENELLGGYRYPDDFGKTEYEIKAKLKSAAAARLYGDVSTEIKKQEKSCQEGPKVDRSKLQEIGTAYSWEVQKDRLYSGAKLIGRPEGVKLAKEAGIKTIIALEGCSKDEYHEKAKEYGINQICLDEIGNHQLNVFSIIPTQFGGKLLSKLINDADCWVTKNQDGSTVQGSDKAVLDLQEFIDIMDGKNKDLPHPIYYGCCYGTERTYAWTTIYNILKDADRTKPLDKERLEKLSELYDELEDVYRY